MTTETILLILLIVIILGLIPTWSYSRSWGYAPMSVLSLVLVIFIIWAIAGERPLFRSSGSLEQSVENVSQDVKAAGRNLTDSVRDAVN